MADPNHTDTAAEQRISQRKESIRLPHLRKANVLSLLGVALVVSLVSTYVQLSIYHGIAEASAFAANHHHHDEATESRIRLKYHHSDILPLRRAMLKDNQRQQPRIPHKMIFTYKHNVLTEKRPAHFYDNVLNTIGVYRAAWKNPNATVWFLDNHECQTAIDKVEPALVRHFNRESHGAFKSDICRAAALYLTGGYYFDCDMRVIQAFVPPANVTFATSYGHRRDNFFQSFTAVKPTSPILKESLKLMLLYYDEQEQMQNEMSDTDRSFNETIDLYGSKYKLKDTYGDSASLKDITDSLPGVDSDMLKTLSTFFDGEQKLHGNLVGPSTLKDAHDKIMQTSSDEFSLVLNEINLQVDKHRGLYPSLVRQNGTGCCCNYIVHCETEQQPYFFSRILGAGVRCQRSVSATGYES